jgi:murein DD-endopeptidase MepM/ murein hydrolase activator NlpD
MRQALGIAVVLGGVVVGIGGMAFGPGPHLDPPPPERVDDPLLEVVPLADGFDFPVGAPDAQGYFDAQPFGENHHLGSDWNGDLGGGSDYGDPVYSVANGWVARVENPGPGWGLVVTIVHRTPDLRVESLYAHLSGCEVSVGDQVTRGQVIGAIGDADGRYISHLHFELRSIPGMEIGPGYAREKMGWVDPTQFIELHRPR